MNKQVGVSSELWIELEVHNLGEVEKEGWVMTAYMTLYHLSEKGKIVRWKRVGLYLGLRNDKIWDFPRCQNCKLPRLWDQGQEALMIGTINFKVR